MCRPRSDSFRTHAFSRLACARLRAVQDFAAHQVQKQEAEDEVEPCHPDQREQHVAGADDVAVAVLRAKETVD